MKNILLSILLLIFAVNFAGCDEPASDVSYSDYENDQTEEKGTILNTLLKVIIGIGLIIVIGCMSDKIGQSKRIKSNISKFNLPKFKDSGWVLFYVICGWIGLVAMIVFIVEEESTFAFMMLGCSLSCFFGAHVLRLQEKVAFHAEQQTDHAERQTIHAEKQTELLEKISKPSVQPPPIIEDKE